MELEDGIRILERTESEDERSVRRNSCLPRRTLLEKILFVMIAKLAAIVIGLTIALAIINRENLDSFMKLKAAKNIENQTKSSGSNETHTKTCGNNETQIKASRNNENQICFTSSCITEASYLLESMDLTVDPCKDFYSFVCGKWIQNTYLTSNTESQFTKMTKTIILRVKEILGDLEKEVDLPVHKRKVSDFYKGCMKQAHRDLLGAQELLSDLEKFGGWPLIKEDWNASAFSWSNLMVDLFKNGYISNMLFSITVDIDARNTSRSLISVGNPLLSFGYKIYYGLQVEGTIASYKEIILQLAKLLRGDINEEKSMAAIENALRIEFALARISEIVDFKNLESFYHLTTLEKLEETASMIPWRKLLQELLPYGTEFSDDERIMVTAPSMLKGLNDVLKRLSSSDDGKKALANYMFYRAVFDAANHLSRNFTHLINKLLGSGKEMWEVCSKLTMDSFPSSLAASYATKYQKNTSRQLLERMLDDLRSSLLDDIQNSGWLDDETKQYAILKVRKMQSTIAYGDEIMDDGILNDFYKDINITDDHFKNVKQVIMFKFKKTVEGLDDVREIFRRTNVNGLLKADAYYLFAQNSIFIPVGLLQDTIFAPDRPNYITYGSLGMIVAHELTHAFDSSGCLYDAEGNNRMWWTPNSWMKFQEKTKCFKDQYSKYYTHIDDKESFVNGTFTLGENMADNGGLQTAYNAYMKVLERTGPEKSLPSLPYNSRQMFWISFASVWCEKETEESSKYSMMYNAHAPPQFRVIGSLSNTEEFAQDFKCKLHSFMHPRSKCSLWK